MIQRIKKLLIAGLMIWTSVGLDGQLTPTVAISEMTRGINLGNSLDATPTETSWGNPLIQEYYFDDFKNAGFTCVRIPVTWRYHVSKTLPYTIDPDWLDRVDTIVTWALDRGLYVIINAHHEDGIKSIDTMSNSVARADTIARYDSIWSQVSNRFMNKSDHLLFEMLNEPHDMSQASLNSYNTRILSIIRKTNPTRLVVFSGTSYSGSNQLISTAIPDPDDPYLIGYFHSYDPWSFAGQAQGTYGSSGDINATASIFSQVNSWSESHSIPVTLNECGAVKQCDYNSRMIYYATIVEQALKNNMAFNVWDDNGTFQTYDRNTRNWNDAKDVIIYTYKESPTSLRCEVSDSNAVLRWNNRTTQNDSIIVEKQVGNLFTAYATLAPDADSIFLSGLDQNVYHYFRLQTKLHDTLMYSYPIRFKILSPEGIHDEKKYDADVLTVFPNPAHAFITVRTDILIPGETLNIFDFSGKKVSSARFSHNETSIDISEFADGIYFIRLEGQGINGVSKFIKQ